MEKIPCKPDLVIFCTGYVQTFPFLAPGDGYPTPQEADVRMIWRSDQPDVGFFGFIRPNFGKFLENLSDGVRGADVVSI